MQKLLDKAITEYKFHKHSDVVFKPSIPILYFGNLKEYLKSELKIITVGLNPSDAEFGKGRFQKEDGDQITSTALEHELNSYFTRNPYKGWFNSSYERILQNLQASFYDDDYPLTLRPDWMQPQKNRVLHTDICSPLATTPTWSKLNIAEQKKLEDTGISLWKNLISELSPNLILISVAAKHLVKLGDLDWGWHEIKLDENKIYKFRTAMWGNSLIVWGTASRQPFAPLTNVSCADFTSKILSILNTSYIR